MGQIIIPKNPTELLAVKDDDLEQLRLHLDVEAQKLRELRRVIAREAERRAYARMRLKTEQPHAVSGAGGIASAEKIGKPGG